MINYSKNNIIFNINKKELKTNYILAILKSQIIAANKLRKYYICKYYLYSSLQIF